MIKAHFILLGTTTFEIDGKKVTYEGLLNKRGKAFGNGTATRVDSPDVSYAGTFRDNELHGLGKIYYQNFYQLLL